MSTTTNLHEYIETHTLRCEASYRGGGIEIDASEYLGIEGARMTAYQNYLGGGMLGAIQGSMNGAIERNAHASKYRKALKLNSALKRYYHELTNHDDDEWESATFEENQRRPESAY